MRNTLIRRALLLLAVALLPLLAGCAAQRLHKEGLELIEQGRVEEGLSKLEEAVREAPADVQYKATLGTARERVTARLNAAADRALAADNVPEAETLYRRVLAIEPRSERALAGLRAIERRGSVEDLVKQGQAELKKGDADAATRLAESALAINPRHPGALKLRAQIDDAKLKEGLSYPTLRSKLSKPVTLEFRDANLKMVFDVLSRTSGINFVFDKDVKSDLKATIFVKKIAVEDAIELLLLQSGLEKRVINENTLMIFPNTPQKIKEFQDLVIKSFYIANADVKQTLNMLKTLLKTKDIYVDEKLNLLIMRDTPDAIRIAEKLISAQDIAEPEVVLEVEVFEIVNTDNQDLGVKYPRQAVLGVDPTVSTDGTGTTTGRGFTVDFFKGINSGRFFFDDTLTINLKKDLSRGNILANPRIRVKNREKAKVLIGDRVPVISSSTTPTTTATQGTNTVATTSIVVSQSVQYLDVGLKLDVEPVVHLDDQVAIKLNMDVTTLGSKTETTSGTVAYQVGTRTANTVLQLKDGETATLMGLIREDEVNSIRSMPGLADLPILGRLFSNKTTQKTKTEIVLQITPRIVRNLAQQIPQITEMVSGSETSLKARLPGQRPVVEAESVPLRGTGPAPATRPTAPVPAPVPGPSDGAQNPAAVGQAVTLSLEGSHDVRLGQEFVVVLMAQADQPMLSTAIQVSYDTQALRVVEVTEGDLMKQEGAQTNFSQKVDPASGKIFVGLSRAGAAGAAGRGNLLTVKFAAQAEKPAAPVSVAVFSGVGAGNRLLPANLPAPLDVKVSP